MYLLWQRVAESIFHTIPKAAVTQIHCSNIHHLRNPKISPIICPAHRVGQNTYLYILDYLWV